MMRCVMKSDIFGGWAVRRRSAFEVEQRVVQSRVRKSKIVDGLEDVQAIIFDK